MTLFISLVFGTHSADEAAVWTRGLPETRVVDVVGPAAR